MLYITIILLKIVLLLNDGTDIRKSEPSMPIRLINYSETVIVSKNGDASSFIHILLNDTCSDIFLPLLINKNAVVVDAPKSLQTMIIGSGESRFFHI